MVLLSEPLNEYTHTTPWCHDELKSVAINYCKSGRKPNCAQHKVVKSPSCIIICCNVLLATHIICFA